METEILSAAPTRTRPVVPLAAGELMLLTDAATCWQVEDGQVDIFVITPAADVKDGGGQVRRFLFTQTKGGLLFPVEPALDGSMFGVVAWRPALLSALTMTDACARDGGAGIDRWLAGIIDGVAQGLVPHPAADHRLRQGQDRAMRSNEVVSCRRGVAWLESRTAPLFLGLEPVATGAGRCITPVTPEAWVSTEAAETMACRSTSWALDQPDFTLRLTAFHECAVQALLMKERLGRADELNRLRDRERREKDGLAEAAIGVAEALSGATIHRSGSVASGEHLMRVVGRVGRELGLSVQRPVKVRASDADKPPTMDEIARVSNFRARRVRLPAQWWSRDLGTMIGEIKETGEPVALVHRAGTYHLVEADGRHQPVDAGIAARIAPFAHVCHRKLADRKLKWSQILLLGVDQARSDAGLVAIAGILSGLLGMVAPMLTGYVFSTLVPGRMSSELGEIGLGLVMVAFAVLLFGVMAGVAESRLDGRLSETMDNATWDRILRWPLRAARRFAVGDMINRADTFTRVQQALRQFVLLSVTSGSLAFGSLVVMGLHHMPSALTALALLIIQTVVATVAGIAQAIAYSQGESAGGIANAMLFQIVTGISKLRLAAAENRAFLVWHARHLNMRKPMQKARRVTNAYQSFLAAFNILAVAALFLAVALLKSKDFPTPSFIAVVTAFGSVIAATARLSNGILALSMTIPTLPMAKPLAETLPEPILNRVDPGRLSGQIEVNNLTFRYAADEPAIFGGLSFSVSSGEFVAIVGPSGCGKSTLVRLLLGLENPGSGAIFYDGFDLRGLDLACVRTQVGTVIQGGRLMPGSIIENIRGESGATEGEIRGAIEAAGLAEDIKAMPMGFHTVLTDASRTLSGGQVQRILLARALVARPPILVLDEATSALDNRTQASVMKHLSELSATRLVIAHRLSTVAEADRILVLNSGQLAESGSYHELMARNGLFARMAARQLM